MTKYMDSGGLSHFMTKVKAAIAATVTGVKGNAESTYRTGQVNITAANVGALGASDNAVSATKLQTARSINVGNKATGTATNFDGTANITVPVNTLLTDALTEPNIVKSGTKTSLPLVDTLKGNKLALLPADQIIIEETTDGGTTWTDAGISDSQKQYLFLGTVSGTSVPIPLLNGKRNSNCGIRITFTSAKYNVPSGTAETSKYNYWNTTYAASSERYGTLQSIYIWLSALEGGMSCKLEKATPSSPNSWSVVFNRDTTEALTGNSGGNYIAFSDTVFGGYISQTQQAWNWRLTFFTRSSTGGTYEESTYAPGSRQNIQRICGYGANLWVAPNNIAAIGHLYTWNTSKDATFPASIFPGANNTGSVGASTLKWASVYATTFIGNLSGNATTATTATTADKLTGFSSRSTSMAWGNQTGTVLTCLSTPAGGGLGFRDNNPSSGQVSMTIDGTVYVKEGMKRVLDESDLPLSIANGGTGATTADAAWSALGGGAIGKKASLAASDIPSHASTATTYGVGSDSNYGHLKLSGATNSTSGTSGGIAATPSAVKAAYDLANTANTNAGSAMSAATGGLIFKITYSVSGSNVVCAAHVYSAGSEVTSSHADSCFVWSMSLNGGSSWTSLGTGKTKTVSAMSTYGGNVKCDFTPAS